MSIDVIFLILQWCATTVWPKLIIDSYLDSVRQFRYDLITISVAEEIWPFIQ